MPALTINTDMPPPRESSPTRPPISPITPPPGAAAASPSSAAAAAAAPRQTYTHTSQATQIGRADPPPEPIDFDANADTIALKSAISVLQVQRRRAQEDIQRLSMAMGEAVDDPEAFVRDLAGGKVGHGDVPLDDDDDSNDNEEETEERTPNQRGLSGEGATPQRAWHSLPKKQEIVRTPPVNWSQYAVVGDSLDKLHREQISTPSQGQPATYANGAYEFKTGRGAQEPYKGVAAPYIPGKDRIDRQDKGKGLP